MRNAGKTTAYPTLCEKAQYILLKEKERKKERKKESTG
jgi:hypothetical protein